MDPDMVLGQWQVHLVHPLQQAGTLQPVTAALVSSIQHTKRHVQSLLLFRRLRYGLQIRIRNGQQSYRVQRQPVAGVTLLPTLCGLLRIHVHQDLIHRHVQVMALYL